MIRIHKLNGDEFILNPHHIEKIEERPDTVITLTNEKVYIVKETADEIIDLIIQYQQRGPEKYRAQPPGQKA
ncbi:MAG: flagellar FlbD family protein [Spirochaetes bacterium]|nr:flagellar FlbD family protein [Spirochaetota bacterium]